MTKAVVPLLLVAIAIMANQIAGSVPAASADVQVITNTATNQFPNGIQFQLYFSSDQQVSDVRLRFRILPDGVNASVRPNCTEGRVMNCQTVVGNVGQTYMVPGAEIVYSWQVTDDSGGRFQSDESTTTYEDTRFQWESLTDGNLTVHYYFGDEASHRSVLDTAKETIARFSALEKTTIDFPVKIWVYKTAEEMQPAVASRRGQGNDSTIQTLGEVGASDTALVSSDTDFLDIVRHELTHVVTGAATRDHLVDIPVWINEGLSTYAQNNLLPNEEQALANAIQRNSVLPITSLGSSARGTGSVVSLFYAESGSIIRFMIEDLGEDKFGDFIAAMKDDTPDGALQTVYGMDTLGLENAWRASVGLGDVGASTPAPQSQNADATPTRTPAQTPTTSRNNNTGNTPTPPQSASGSTGSGGGVSVFVFVIAGLVAVMVGLLAAAGILIFKGRQGA